MKPAIPNTKPAIPNIPLDIRSVRIGTCYDAFARKIIPDRNAIDVNKLEKGMVEFTSGKAELILRANSTSTKNVQETFFGLDSKAKFGPWVTASYNMSLASSETDSSSRLSCFCAFVYKDQTLRMLDQTPGVLFRCMTDDFQAAYTDVVTADKEHVMEKYLDFIRVFGYGCVTKLHLFAGSAFIITAKHDEHAKTLEEKYNSSAGIGFSAGVSAGVAANYAKNEASADRNAHVEIVGVSLPENAPTASWCEKYTTAFVNKAFEVLAKDADTIQAYSGTAPVAPDIPEGKKDEKKLPDDKPDDISEKMKKQLMDEDGFKGTWEEYCKKQEEILDNIKPEKVAKEANDRLQESLAYDLSGLPPLKSLDSVEVNDPDPRSLGGYIPHHFEFKLWSDLFPALPKIEIPETSFNPLYLAKAYVYYLTRLQFVSYFNLLIDIGVTAYTRRPEADRDACQRKCEQLLKRIMQAYEDFKLGNIFDEACYNKIVAEFEQGLLKSPDFKGEYLYKKFFQYYDFFQSNMSGFALVNYGSDFLLFLKEKSYMHKDGEWVGFEEGDLNMELFMRDCMRCYPVFIENGNGDYINLYGYSRKDKQWLLRSFLSGAQNLAKFCKPKTDKQNYKYHLLESESAMFSQFDIRFYGADEKILKSLEKTPMAAVPMIPPLNFEDIYAFLGKYE